MFSHKQLTASAAPALQLTANKSRSEDIEKLKFEKLCFFLLFWRCGSFKPLICLRVMLNHICTIRARASPLLVQFNSSKRP